MPDFVARLAQRGAGLRTSAAPQPAAAPWAAASLGGPADIAFESEPGAAYRSELSAPAVFAEAAPSPAPASALAIDHSRAPPTSRLPEALSPPTPKATIEQAIVAEPPRPPAHIAAVPSRDELARTLHPRVATAVPAMRYLDPGGAQAETPAAAPASPAEAKANPPPGNPSASAAPQPPRPANAAASAPPPRDLTAAARPVPILTLPQSTRPATAPMPDAAAPEQRPIQVRIGRVEVRASQPATVSGPRPARADGQGFAAMQMARAWLGRSFY